MQFQNKKVVVVGGSSGIGYATAAMAKADGAEVIIASRPGERLEKAAKQLGVKAIAADVTSDEAVENLFRTTGPVDHVVVTAAVLKTAPIKTAVDGGRACHHGMQVLGRLAGGEIRRDRKGRFADHRQRVPERAAAAGFGYRRPPPTARLNPW